MSSEHTSSESAKQTASRQRAWSLSSIGITVALVLLSALAGLILLPLMQKNVSYASVWDAICSAAGLRQPSADQAPVEPTFKTSQVVLTSQMLRNPGAESIGRGATLGQRCAICHGPTGVSRADSPNLAGQYAGAIYKELLDFKSGARVNSVMTPFAEPLSDQDIVDLAAYYSYLPRLPGYHPPTQTSVPRIVINGAPMRGISACGSCHGSLDNKAGSPWLEQQPEPYIVSQLNAFASGERHNDIGQQMRNIARRMTADEMAEVAHYYASQPATAE
jgi:cytochrome c553